MRPGRGLIDQEVYDELIKIPGARQILLSNTTDHRRDPRTQKVRVEIHENAWPKVKSMVQNLKRFKAGKPQMPFRQSQSVATRVKARKPKETKYRKGQKVQVSLIGAGATTHEEGIVLRVSKGKVWLDSGPGNDPSGPFDARTGDYLGFEMPGFHQRVAPLGEEKI